MSLLCWRPTYCHPELVSGPQPAPLSFRALFLKSTFYKILACARMTEGQHGRKISPKYKISRPKMRKSHHTRPFFKPLKSFRGFILRFFVIPGPWHPDRRGMTRKRALKPPHMHITHQRNALPIVGFGPDTHAIQAF